MNHADICGQCNEIFEPTENVGIMTCDCHQAYFCILCEKRGYRYNIVTQHRDSVKHRAAVDAVRAAVLPLGNVEAVIAAVVGREVAQAAVPEQAPLIPNAGLPLPIRANAAAQAAAPGQAPVAAQAAADPVADLEGRIAQQLLENRLLALERDAATLRAELAESERRALRATQALARMRDPEVVRVKVEVLDSDDELAADLEISSPSSEDEGVDDPNPPPKKTKFLTGIPPDPKRTARIRNPMPKFGSHRRPGGTPPLV
jgi:hypothetical protein